MSRIDELDGIFFRNAHQFGSYPRLLEVILDGRKTIHSSDFFIVILICNNKSKFARSFELLSWHVVLRVIDF